MLKMLKIALAEQYINILKVGIHLTHQNFNKNQLIKIYYFDEQLLHWYLKMLKIPPPLLVLILVISNYFSSKKIDLILLPNQNLISFIILLIGVFILITPIFKFIKSKTTIDPIKFKKVNKLITSGIYKYSRNPMYLGLLMIVISTSILYLNIFSITTPTLFYFWINRFQIKREEIFLTDKFGKEYLLYMTKTRRWI